MDLSLIHSDSDSAAQSAAAATQRWKSQSGANSERQSDSNRALGSREDESFLRPTGSVSGSRSCDATLPPLN